MQEADDDNASLGERQKGDANFHEQNEGQRTEETVEEIQAIQEVKELVANGRYEEADKNIAAFLRTKGLSDDLVKTLINFDLTDERVRLLKALDFNDNDIGDLRDLWRAKNQVSKSGDSPDSSTPSEASLDVQLSRCSLYLKNVLGKPLIGALREIIATKPADPVEYLAHWLFHFKASEEKNKCQKEEELELLINREKLKTKRVEDIKMLSSEKEKVKEEPGEDWDFPFEREKEEPGEDRDYFHYRESQVDNVSDL